MKLAFTLLLFSSFSVQAQDFPEMPIGLFGIELGSAYEYSPGSANESTAGAFPVDRFVTEPISVHEGISLYFEPMSGNAILPFPEIVPTNSSEQTVTYRVFVFPVLPGDVSNLDDLQERELPQTVTMIEWSRRDNRMTERDDYRWALDLCESIEDDLGIEPEITELVESDLFRCLFSYDERELEVTSVLGQTIQLSLNDEIEGRMASDTHWILRGLSRGTSVEATRTRLAERALAR